MNNKKFLYLYSRNGTSAIFNTLFSKIGLKYRFKNAIDYRINWITREIKKFTKSIVCSGLYKGMKIHEEFFWVGKDISTKLLGLYELEVQNNIKKLQTKKKFKKKYLINIGGGDGYHAIGLLRAKLFTKVIIFEKDLLGRKIINKNLSANNQKSKVVILEEATKDTLLSNLKKISLKNCFFLIDIEGDEYSLLNNNNLKKLSKSILLIELHYGHSFSKNELVKRKFVQSLKKFYTVQEFFTESRDLSKFKFLYDFEDVDRWLSVSEFRKNMMSWVICIPKKN